MNLESDQDEYTKNSTALKRSTRFHQLYRVVHLKSSMEYYSITANFHSNALQQNQVYYTWNSSLEEHTFLGITDLNWSQGYIHSEQWTWTKSSWFWGEPISVSMGACAGACHLSVCLSSGDPSSKILPSSLETKYKTGVFIETSLHKQKIPQI